MRFTRNGFFSQGVACFGELENFLGAGIFATSARSRSFIFEPGRHCGAGGESLPAAAKAASARRSGGIHHVMPDFGMRFVRAAIELTIQNNSSANPGAYSDVNQPRLAFACAPGGFSQCGGVPIVFKSDAHIK